MDRLTRPGIEAEQTAVRFMDGEVKIQDIGDKLLDLILNGPTINGIKKDTLRHLVRQLYGELKLYEETGMSPDDIREFAADVANQFGYHTQHNGRLVLTHGGLSTLEWAFDILGWENPHPDPENECQYEGCHHYASCGTPTKDGYKRVCGHHFAVLQANARAEAALAKDNNIPTKEEE